MNSDSSPDIDRDRLEFVFSETVDLKGDPRSGRLDDLCRDNPELRREVESLLTAFEMHSETVKDLFDGLPLATPASDGSGSESPPTLGLEGRQVGHYRILGKLGGGGMGVVYHAHDPRLDRTVALKFLPRHLHADEDAKTRFRHEAQAASALDHANICTIHDIGETDDGRLFIAMAHYSGETIKTKVARGPIPVPDAISYAIQIAQGLEKAHAAGIIHRDIKPANVLITDDGVAKILDFGIAKISGINLTRSGAALGTVSYMSPEQLRGAEVDQRADIWSLGALLYQTLTGTHPFKGESDPALLYSILNTEPDFSLIEDLDLRTVVETCLRKVPDERFATASDTTRALESVVAGLGIVGIRLPRRRRKMAQLVVGASSILVVVMIAVWTWFTSRPPPDQVTAPKREMLVVLPFENLGDSTNQYFADGMAEELSIRLGSVNSLAIVSRNTANRYRNTEKSVAELGQELGVQYVIGGSVRWSEQPNGARRVRVSPHLTRVSDQVQLWADSYDRDLADVLDIQRDVARKVVSSLQKTLEPEEIERLEARLTDDPDAYEEYLRGLELYRRLDSDSTGLAKAVEHFRKALQLDSLFVEPALMLTRISGQIVWSRWFLGQEEPEDWSETARHETDRIKRASPGSRTDLLASGYYNYYVLRDYAGALTFFMRATEVTQDADAFEAIGRIQRNLGNMAFALDYFERALALDPDRVDLLRQSTQLAYLLRRFEKQLEFRERLAALDAQPLTPCNRASLELKIDWNTERARRTIAGAIESDDHCHDLDFFDRRFQLLFDHHEAGEDIWFLTLATVYNELGLFERERAIWEDVKRDAEMGDASPKINQYGFLALGEAGLGNREAALVALDSFRVNVGRDKGATVSNYNTFAAHTFVKLGMFDELVDVLESEVSGPGYLHVVWLRWPWFDAARDHLGFQNVMRKFETWERPDGNE